MSLRQRLCLSIPGSLIRDAGDKPMPKRVVARWGWMGVVRRRWRGPMPHRGLISGCSFWRKSWRRPLLSTDTTCQNETFTGRIRGSLFGTLLLESCDVVRIS